MPKVNVTLPFTDMASLSFALDERNLGEVVRPAPVAAVPDEAAAITTALDAPLGTPALEEMVRPGQRVLILSDDNTRPTPVHKILPLVLERLERGGVAEADIAILMALGTHRPMTEPELRAKLGAEVVRRFPVANHRYDDQMALYDAGTTPEGIRIGLSRAVVEADFVLGLGNIVPHPHPGYAGGAKILYPGVASQETVAGFHLVGLRDPTNYLGHEDAPARRAIEALADTVGLSMVVDTVLTPDHGIYQVFCGQHRQVQAAGQRAARAVYGVPVQRRYDIVIANSYPAFLEFWQGSKGLLAADLIVKPGGTIILVTACPDGVAITHGGLIEYLRTEPAELLHRIEAGEVKDPIAASVCLKLGRVRERVQVAVVSPGLTETEVRDMGYEHYASVEEAVDAKLAEYGRGTQVAVITHGGETAPYLA
ncbi:MAG: nickel-dependent lactate racemase [Chloroflexota bacterium]